MELDGRVGENLIEDKGGEILIRINCMKKLFPIKMTDRLNNLPKFQEFADSISNTWGSYDTSYTNSFVDSKETPFI